MKSITKIIVILFVIHLKSYSQTNNPSPYCTPLYLTVPCNQGGPSNSPSAYVNDNINHFVTSGAVVNISNMNSGCNGMANNYIYYCQHNLQVNPGTVITVSLQPGINYSQGFAIFIDWNQDNIFQNPSEKMVGTSVTPPAAWATSSFNVPSTQATGIYRMRVRSVYATAGNFLDPCTSVAYGECEDYNVYVGISVPAAPTVTASSTNNSPLCPGQTASLSALTSGTTGFQWSGPLNYTSNIQNPILSNTTSSMAGTYYVAVTSGTCPVLSGTYVWIKPAPTLSISSNINPLCTSNSATLTSAASTAVSYTWSTGSNTITTVVSPSVTTSYTLSASNNTCVTSLAFTQSVSICTSLKEDNNFSSKILVYPNPAQDVLYIETPQQLNIILYNSLGKIVLEKNIDTNEKLDVSGLPNGIYDVFLDNGSLKKTIKITKN